MSIAHTPMPSPCVGLCSTTYGDLVCLGCKRFVDEVRIWPGATQEQKQVIYKRLSDLIVPLMARYFVVENETLLKDRMQQLQVRYYDALPAIHIAWILLRKRIDQVEQESLAAFGLAQQPAHMQESLPQLWNRALDELQHQSIAAHQLAT